MLNYMYNEYTYIYPYIVNYEHFTIVALLPNCAFMNSFNLLSVPFNFLMQYIADICILHL